MGGNIFKNTNDIRKEKVKGTIVEYIKELNRIGIFISYKLVGSAGKKEKSGDIDLAIDKSDILKMRDDFDKKKFEEIFKKYKKRSRTATDEMIEIRTIMTLISEKIKRESELIEVSDKITTSNIFFNFPIIGSKGRVQIDWIVGKIEWLKFANYSKVYEEETIKGLHRTQLILAILQKYGYSFNHQYGVKNKESEEIEADDVNKINILMSKLLNTNIDINILNDYFLLYEIIKDDEEVKDIYLKILDRTRCDIPSNLQEYYKKNKKRLGLKGNFLPETSKLRKKVI